MVVVKIELWPGGDSDQAKPLGGVTIANDGTAGVPALGNYDVQLSHAGKFFGRPGAWKSGRVEGFKRELSPYHLVLRAIQAALWGKQ